MDALTVAIREVAPGHPALAPLIARHLAFCRAASPACNLHSKEADDLSAAGARMFVAEQGDVTLAMGALVPLEPGHGEIKSMHVVEAARGTGLAHRMLTHLIAEGRASGWSRLSLETGVQEPFAPARILYERAGFRATAPFGGYRDDPASLFMTLDLLAMGAGQAG